MYLVSRQLDESSQEIDDENGVNFNKIALAAFQQEIVEGSFVSDNGVSISLAENSNNITLNLDAFRFVESKSNLNIDFNLTSLDPSLSNITYSPVIEHQTTIKVSVSNYDINNNIKYK